MNLRDENMVNISFRLYKSLALVPKSQMDVLSRYKWPFGTFSSILYQFDSGCGDHFKVHNVLVMYEDRRPIGWCIHWTEGKEQRSSLGFWVDAPLRGRGLGMMLIREAFRRWYQVYRPNVFDGVADYIWPKLVRESKRKEISPNASVTV